MSSVRSEIEKAKSQTNEVDDASSPAEADITGREVTLFLAESRFFPVAPYLADQILSLNQRLGNHLIESELDSLPEEDPESGTDELVEVDASWFNAILNRVSSILFHQEGQAPDADVPWEDLVSAFQKTVSEKIYDRLGLLSLSPHAREGGIFSLREELTEGIAEDIGLGLYRRNETPAHLRAESEAALLSLALEFQRWLLEDCHGAYPAAWGDIRVRGTQASAGLTVWLEADAEAFAISGSAAAEGFAASS